MVGTGRRGSVLNHLLSKGPPEGNRETAGERGSSVDGDDSHENYAFCFSRIHRLRVP